MSRAVFRARRFILIGDSAVTEAVQCLITLSQWFVVMPLPDAHWRIIVKLENGSALAEFIQSEALTLAEEPTDVVYCEEWALREAEEAA